MQYPGRALTPDDIAIGAKIHIARIAADMNLEQLAEKSGLSRTQIFKYERGEDRVTAGRLNAVAKILNVPITFFFKDIQSILNQPMKQALTLQAAQFFGKIKNPELQKEILILLKTMNIKEV